MSNTPSPPPAPCPHATGVRAWLRAALEAWLLTWLVRRLPAGYRRMLERGDELPPSFVAAFAPDAPVYAAAVALGFLPDWILPGIRNRGMRSTPGFHLQTCRRSARAPPADRACRPSTNPFPPSADRWRGPGRGLYSYEIGSLRIIQRKAPGLPPGPSCSRRSRGISRCWCEPRSAAAAA
jgi:hypothetical protein